MDRDKWMERRTDRLIPVYPKNMFFGAIMKRKQDLDTSSLDTQKYFQTRATHADIFSNNRDVAKCQNVFRVRVVKMQNAIVKG